MAWGSCSALLLISCLCCYRSHAFSILRGPFPSLHSKPIPAPSKEADKLFFGVPKLQEQISGRNNDSFIVFSTNRALESSDAKRLLYRSFHTVSITYGWCLAPADVKALKSLREELFGELGFISDPFYLAKIEVALQLAFHAHHGQKRRSGEAFVNHPVAVAKLLASLRMDPDSIVAGLLHDTVEDTYVSLSDIQSVFGQSVRRLVEGETKVSRLPRSARDGPSMSNEQAENLCHLIMAMAEDWRVLVVKLADRLHNMRTLDAMPRQKQERTARETLEIFVPLAHKLGAWAFKTELEELAFRILHPTEHLALSYMTENQLALLSSLQTTTSGGGRMSSAEALTGGIPRLLKNHKVFGGLIEGAHVSLQRKPAYQIWKEDRTLLNIEKQEDLLVARVVLSRKERGDAVLESDGGLCYRVLELIQAAFPLGPSGSSKVQDFIFFPKENGYQALHASIRVKGFPSTIQLQVCMDWMDDVARLGPLAKSAVATAGMVDQQQPGRSADVTLELPWLRAMGQAAESVLEAEPSVTAPALMRSLREHLTVRRLVFTPEGEILNLMAHEGICTARDAALAQLKGGADSGDFQRLVGASVNGRHVPLTKALSHGDVVRVITRPYAGRRMASSSTSLRSESAVQSKKPVKIWPWCLIGNEDGLIADRSALQAMWGSRVQPQRAVRPGGFAVDAGEVQYLREAELRHGRMAMAAILYWWLSPLLALSSYDSLEATNKVAEMLLWRGMLSGTPSLPPATPGLLQMAVLVGVVELAYSVLMTKRLDDSGLVVGEQPRSPSSSSPSGSRSSGGGGQGGGSGGSSVALGVTAAESIATILGALRQQELSWGRLSMLCVMSLLAQAAVLSIFGGLT